MQSPASLPTSGRAAARARRAPISAAEWIASRDEGRGPRAGRSRRDLLPDLLLHRRGRDRRGQRPAGDGPRARPHLRGRDRLPAPGLLRAGRGRGRGGLRGLRDLREGPGLRRLRRPGRPGQGRARPALFARGRRPRFTLGAFHGPALQGPDRPRQGGAGPRRGHRSGHQGCAPTSSRPCGPTPRWPTPACPPSRRGARWGRSCCAGAGGLPGGRAAADRPRPQARLEGASRRARGGGGRRQPEAVQHEERHRPASPGGRRRPSCWARTTTTSGRAPSAPSIRRPTERSTTAPTTTPPGWRPSSSWPAGSRPGDRGRARCCSSPSGPRSWAPWARRTS